MLIVPYVRLTEEQESFCITEMIQGSIFLKRWAEYWGVRKGLHFRKLLFKAISDSSLMAELETKIPLTLLEEFRLERKFIISVHIKKQPILDNQTIEWAMICSYSALARKHARKWHKIENTKTGMSLEDYQSESYMTLMDCIYSYNDPQIEFGTFAWAALKNKMIAVNNKHNPFCPLKIDDQRLLKRFDEMKVSLNRPATFDEIVLLMGLNDEEKLNLILATRHIILASQICQGGESNSDPTYDYTSYRRGIDNEKDFKLIGMNLKDAIADADLTEFERQVLEASLRSSRGWQTEMAKNSFNPKTQKPFTKMWIGIVLESAKKKVQRQLEKMTHGKVG